MEIENIEKWKNVYGVYGHSAVEICSWTKKSLKNEGECYKNKFYGAETHRCAQISPTMAWCNQNCIFCWRPTKWMSYSKNINFDEPDKIIKGLVEKRKQLLSGFGGNEKVDKKKFYESYNLFPSHWAISLSGEPTLYPKLPEMIKELRKHKEVKTIFVVTNGQNWKMIEEMNKKGLLPTQLYVSISAPNEKLYKQINVPKEGASWENLMRTMSLLGKINTRTVIRFTMINHINNKDEYLEEYAKIFKIAQSDFIELKSYMHLGQSRERLKEENMCSHEEVKEYAMKLLKLLPEYKFEDEDPKSRIVLLKNVNSPYPNKIKNVISERRIK